MLLTLVANWLIQYFLLFIFANRFFLRTSALHQAIFLGLYICLIHRNNLIFCNFWDLYQRLRILLSNLLHFTIQLVLCFVSNLRQCLSILSSSMRALNSSPCDIYHYWHTSNLQFYRSLDRFLFLTPDGIPTRPRSFQG